MTTSYEYANQHAERFIAQLVEWLKIPSISTAPEHKGDVRRAAEWLAEDMRRIGLEHVAVMETSGHPVVYSDWLHAGENQPTVLLYGHYDVQPAVVEDGWATHPFEPTQVGEKLFARGSTDDKGQVMIQAKAIESLLATGSCPVNIKFIIEGEEEIGSPNLAKFIEAHQDLLKADICVISDTGVLSVDTPFLTYSLRGLMSLTLVVSGPVRDLHSGSWGGIVHNPAQAIAEIVAQLHTPDGKVTVPGFYDDVLPLSNEERQRLSDMSDEEWQGVMGDLPAWGVAGFTKNERIGAYPTLEINGIASGYAGDGFKTVLPAKAIAKISCRLVANQDPNDIFRKVRDHILSLAPATAHVEVLEEHHGHPALTPIDHPAVEAAIRAYSKHFKNEPVYHRGGGSIPVVSDIQRILGLPVVLLGFGLPDNGAHGPNESFHLGMYQKGVNTIITYLNEVKQ